ncbi:hypothetical protein CFN78_08840 [Amycolatopsis antarctica]|uniref:HTH tetR-type domain-containing protein n=1 Tax=Amycolatopsis antarctica TaxID=1854586 RepID=A0A263D5C0_9PSEU|nr:TetR family transcriptional regulator [Amycolatopsis antarctica]OZM73623.1 hypothetical protein CFN78_08840 [Amycolatopsis antarctica]
MGRGAGPRRRAQLVAAAGTVVGRLGVEAMTTRAIAQEAELPLGLIHYYFKAKNDILAAVLADCTERLVLLIGRSTGDTLADCLRGLLRAVVADQASGEQLAQLQLTVTLMRNPEMAAHGREKYDRLLAALADRFALADPELDADREAAARLAAVMLVMFDGLLLAAGGLSDQSRVDSLVLDSERAVLAVRATLSPGA